MQTSTNNVNKRYALPNLGYILLEEFEDTKGATRIR